MGGGGLGIRFKQIVLQGPRVEATLIALVNDVMEESILAVNMARREHNGKLTGKVGQD